MNNLYYMLNEGCDDTTSGLACVSEDVFPILKDIIENLNKNSTYACMPTIKVYKIPEASIREARPADHLDEILYMSGGKYVIDRAWWCYDRESDSIVYAESVEMVIC